MTIKTFTRLTRKHKRMVADLVEALGGQAEAGAAIGVHASSVSRYLHKDTDSVRSGHYLDSIEAAHRKHCPPTNPEFTLSVDPVQARVDPSSNGHAPLLTRMVDLVQKASAADEDERFARLETAVMRIEAKLNKLLEEFGVKA